MSVSNIVKEILEVHRESMNQLKQDFTTLLEGEAPPPDTILKVKKAFLAETEKNLARLETSRVRILEEIDGQNTVLKDRRTSLDCEIRELNRRIKKQREEFTIKAKSASSVEDENTAPPRGSGGVEGGEIEI
jgi:hypothetical protein